MGADMNNSRNPQFLMLIIAGAALVSVNNPRDTVPPPIRGPVWVTFTEGQRPGVSRGGEQAKSVGTSTPVRPTWSLSPPDVLMVRLEQRTATSDFLKRAIEPERCKEIDAAVTTVERVAQDEKVADVLLGLQRIEFPWVMHLPGDAVYIGQYPVPTEMLKRIGHNKGGNVLDRMSSYLRARLQEGYSIEGAVLAMQHGVLIAHCAGPVSGKPRTYQFEDCISKAPGGLTNLSAVVISKARVERGVLALCRSQP
jgi:hypothetical protein